MSFERYGIGATTVGIRCVDGVILGSEKRISYGGFIVSKAGRKVFKITDRLGVAFAGLFADMQALTKIMEAEIRLYEYSMKRAMSIKSAAKLLSNILYSSKLTPFMSEVLIGGYDPSGFHLYVLDPLGSLLEDDYACLGSGAPIAIGIIEAQYKKDIDVNEGEKIVLRAIKGAIERDSISGDGIDLLIISKEGSVMKSFRV